MTGLYVAAVENIRDQVSRRPSMARKAVFVVEDADRMVPQSASPEAANAFLKLLEEPPDFAWIVLTSSRPEALLPTIRSRSVPLRVAPVATDAVATYLTDRLGAPADRALAVARRADGAVYRARRLMQATESKDGHTSETAADQLLAAALDGSPTARYRAASRYSARGARAELGPALEDLRVRLRDLLCVAVEAASEAHDADRLNRLTGGRAVTDRAVLDALGSVERALEGVGAQHEPAGDDRPSSAGDGRRVRGSSARNPSLETTRSRGREATPWND